MGTRGKGLWGRFEFWRLKKRLRHRHGDLVHSHIGSQLDHSHLIDAVCRRADCWDFPVHRVHPRKVAP